MHPTSSLWQFRHVLLAFLFLRLARTDVDAPCYWPTVQIEQAHGYYPCDPTAYITTCCPEGWTCYSNSLCVVTDPATANSTYPIGSSMRGTCTDPVWNNAVCGDFCLTNVATDENLKACGNDNYCCASDTSCDCSTGTNTFNLQPGKVQTIISVIGLEQTATPTVISPGSTLSTAIATSSKSTLTTSSTASTAANKTPPHAQKSIDKGTKAGIALGIIFGVAAIVAIIFLIKWRFFGGTRWQPPKESQVFAPVDTIYSPPVGGDPYDVGSNSAFSATNPTLNRPEDHAHGNAPFANLNDYERLAPSTVRPLQGPSMSTVGTNIPRTISPLSNDGHSGPIEM